MEIKDIVAVLIEPSATQQRIIKDYFNESGVNVVLAANTGSEGMVLVQQNMPDLVLSAMYLPDMTGTDILIQLREDDSLKETAFILVSSETDFKMLNPVRQAGAVAILGKPFYKKDLETALQATLHYYDPEEIQLENEEIEDIKVLIVDDSRMARKHIRRVLEKMGLEQFSEVENGKEALAVMEENYFDLIITDYNMPEMDGEELIKVIRASSGQKGIPILMVTSEENGSRLSAVKQAGVSAICDKPFETATVRSLIQGVLE